MTFTLQSVVPWGRSYEEYLCMFALSEQDLGRFILGCGDGPAGFNAVLNRRGGHVVSVDPLYRFGAAEIQRQIEQTFDTVLTQTRLNRHEFLWTFFADVEALARARREAMQMFINDYDGARARYRHGSLPALDFEDDSFDLALCSHFLFLYSEQFSAEFHVQSIQELCRVAGQARIFPLLELGARDSRHLGAVIDQLIAEGYNCHIHTVDYEFQRGGNKMLQVAKASAVTQIAR